MADKVIDRVNDTVKEDVQRVRVLAQDAAKSGAYIYPIKARSHPVLYPNFQLPY